jgi:hypothetical protein
VTVTRVADIQLQDQGTTTITVRGAANSVSFTAAAAPVPACDATRTPCRADCDCAADERCIGVMQGAPTTVCARPCELDRDCNGTGKCTRDTAPGGPPFTCDSQPECDLTPNSCPDGFTCNAAACAPIFTLSQTTRHECSCDDDCDPGLRCVQPYDTTASPRCQAICPTDGSWCEGPHVCGELSFDVSGLAGTDAVCGWIGE